MELRRRDWIGRAYVLVGDDGVLLATMQLGMVREAGSIMLGDDRAWTVRRQPGFGPWQAIDAAGAVAATATKTDAMRERVSISWPGGSWTLTRRFGMGLRKLEVQDASGAVVGTIQQRGFSGRTHRLHLPIAPDEVIALTAWMVAVLAQREANAAGAG